MISVHAPAKVNLYLHVLGRRDDGYHELDSLVCFADIHDQITVRAQDDFSFQTEGPFAQDLVSEDGEQNLVVKAARLASKVTGRDLRCAISLQKNIPLGAGLGGGSADAAATLKALCEFWGLNEEQRAAIYNEAVKLGADVPVCLYGQPARVTGIGDIIDPAVLPTNIPAVLVYPNIHCSTPDVFHALDLSVLQSRGRRRISFDHLDKTENDLQGAAMGLYPEIGNILQTIQTQTTTTLSRMTGSGSTCFGLYDSDNDASDAARKLQEIYPNYWVKAVKSNPA